VTTIPKISTKAGKNLGGRDVKQTQKKHTDRTQNSKEGKEDEKENDVEGDNGTEDKKRDVINIYC